MFLSFDGVDGVGKSTQMELFCPWLQQQGRQLVTCRDPGSTQLGEKLREIVLRTDQAPIGRTSEMLLYMAARAQLVEQVIRPALAAGSAVISDRFLLANVVYQGYAGGLDVEQLWQVGQIATGNLHPDLTLVLDMDVDAAQRRLARTLDRMEGQGRDFYERVRQGFLTESRLAHENIVLIDADQAIDDVQADIRRTVSNWLEHK